MTRAFGDKKHKSFIIAEPEIIVYDIYTLLSDLEFRDVFLVLASDGLWNVTILLIKLLIKSIIV